MEGELPFPFSQSVREINDFEGGIFGGGIQSSAFFRIRFKTDGLDERSPFPPDRMEAIPGSRIDQTESLSSEDPEGRLLLMPSPCAEGFP